MESRRIRLLWTAFSNGWLDFKKRSSWNTSREEVIMYLAEQQLLSDICAVKTGRDAAMAEGLMQLKINGFNLAQNSYKDYQRFKFPSLVKDDNIDKVKAVKNTKKGLTDKELKEVSAGLKSLVSVFNKDKKKSSFVAIEEKVKNE